MDPQQTALVLIGYQNDYFATDGVLYRVIEEASRVTGTLANTVDLLEHLSSTPVLIVATPISFTPDYGELTEHPLSIHMGLNSGPVFIGATRFEGLRNTRWTFTVGD